MVQQPQRVVEIVVIPVDGRRFEVSAGLTGSDSWNAFPVRSRCCEPIAVRINVADPGENLGIAGIGLQQVVFDLGCDRCIRGIKVRQRAIDRRGRAGDFSFGRVLRGERLEHWRALFKMRAPQVRIGQEIGGGGIALPTRGIGSTLLQRAQLLFQFVGARKEFKELVAQARFLKPVLAQQRFPRSQIAGGWRLVYRQ